MGSLRETETWQPGVVQDKLSTNYTYLETTNYWTPLNNDDGNNTDETEEINMIKELEKTEKLKGNKWMWRRQEQWMIIDSGETSHFVSEELNLPKGRKVQQTSLPPRQHDTKNINQNQTPFPQTLRGSTRSGYTPRAQTITDERQQNVGWRIYNNLSPGRRRCHDPPWRLNPNHHDQTTSTPWTQTQRRETVDSVRKDWEEYTWRGKQCVQPTVDPTIRKIPARHGKFPS